MAEVHVLPSDTGNPSQSFDDGKLTVSVAVTSAPKSRRDRASLHNEQDNNTGNGSGNSNSDQLSVLALLLTTFRRSLVACRANRDECTNMEISWPTNVRHVAHVTFDRYNGFLGLPVEFELEVPRRVPSASASVFGVSAESMQCCYDSKGNSVPTILLLMQERLYAQGGLKMEGIFRINAENTQEEHVRDQLNKGIVPDDIDVHCLAGLIKAWFRELPSGVLDSLTPDQVLQCNAEEQCVELVKLLPPTQVALLDWAINLMTDVVQEEQNNKMNARNIAMVFAPNMTQMSDPLTALMHAVQVMNFLKTLILKTLREREEVAICVLTTHCCTDRPDEDGYESTGQTLGTCDVMENTDDDEQNSGSVEFPVEYYCRSTDGDSVDEIEEDFLNHFGEKDTTDEEDLSGGSGVDNFSPSSSANDEVRETIGARMVDDFNEVDVYQFRKQPNMFLSESDQDRVESSDEDSDSTSEFVDNENMKNNAEDLRENKDHAHYMVQVSQAGVKSKGGSVINSIDQQTERVEAW
ncbi:rho GTPase-activating protein 2 [Cryptomeria japonica]|uniref:rho GTPase-activating protein 2 n=1 Tax=Cryptomeria japonica TaxID=3369 RepID=UPI0025AC6F60|nr:rho GTPase-activating protein 2 [Cryptomeria japonica]